MPIPNVSTLYQRINRGSEGGNEFARIMNLLLASEMECINHRFNSFSDANGDYKGLDAFSKSKSPRKIGTQITGYQYKFYPQNLTSHQKTNIKESVRKAFEENENLISWILITPEDFLKSQISWFEEFKKGLEFNFTLDDMVDFKIKHGDFPMRDYFTIEHWGHTKIIDLMMRHPHIGQSYYPELFQHAQDDSSGFQLARVILDAKRCNWSASKSKKNVFIYNEQGIPTENKIEDPIFDFYFINNSNRLFLLYSITVCVMDFWTVMKGPAPERILKSLDMFAMKVDFSKKKTTKELEDPIIFRAKEPIRFHVKLEEFLDGLPGNCIEIKFIFNFGEQVWESQEILLSL